MQAKTEAFKASCENAKNANQAQLEQELAEAKHKAALKKAEISQELDAEKAKSLENVSWLKSKIAEKQAAVREKMDEAQADFKAKKANWEAEVAEENAQELMSLAFYYIDEARVAFVEAVAARLKANALKS